MSPPTSSRGRLAVVIGLCAAALLVACGDPSTRSARRQAVGPRLTELRGNMLAFDVVVAGDAVAVVEGGAEVDGRPRPVVTWFDSVDAPGRREPMPAAEPLFDLGAWWTGDEVAVVGRRCEAWTDIARPPDVGETGAAAIGDLCHSSATEVWAFRPESNRWRRVRTFAHADAHDEISLVHGDGPTALLRSAHWPDGADAYELLDSATGAVRAVGSPLPPDLGFDAFVTPCLERGKPVLAVAWEPRDGAASPAFIRRIGGDRVSVAGDGVNLVVLRPAGHEWIPQRLDGPPPSGLLGAQCTTKGVVLTGLSGYAIVSGEGGRGRLSPLPPLPPEAELAEGVPDNVIAHDFGVTPSIYPDGPRPAHAWVLADRSWAALPGFVYESGLEVEGRVGDHLVSTIEADDSTAQRARKVVVS